MGATGAMEDMATEDMEDMATEDMVTTARLWKEFDKLPLLPKMY